jgi:hypothetical protein
MDLRKMISELKRQRDLLDDAIAALERVAAGTHGKRRGRPRKWLKDAGSDARRERAAEGEFQNNLG